jgi:hypothetical protein
MTSNDTLNLLNALAPFYHFGEGFREDAFISEDEYNQIEPQLKKLGTATFDDDEGVALLSIKSEKKFHKTSAESTTYMLRIKANETCFHHVDHIVIQESTAPEYTGGGGRMETRY